jgi:FAD/FMN-containing dehydrogenase
MQLAALDGGRIKISQRATKELAKSLHGSLLLPGDDGYDQARAIWNARIDRRPGMIVRCLDRNDISAAVGFARKHEALLSVRAGGHNHTGFAICDGGLVLDLSAMRAVQVDPDARTARVQGGATFAEYDAATHQAGLASTGAIVSMVGVAGYTLGGGIGWLHRWAGVGCDNLISAEVVTAGGEIVTASASENRDLFWALRGGGGNFGVVSSFQFALHAVRNVLAGIIFHPLEDLPEVGRFIREFNRNAPDELTVWLLMRKAPASPALPVSMHGRLVAGIAVCWAGDVDEGEKVIKPARGFGRLLVDGVKPRPYPDWQRSFDPIWGNGFRNEWMGHYLQELSDEALATLQKYVEAVPSPDTDVKVAHLGGAIARVGEDDTAFGFRASNYALVIQARWKEAAGDDANLRWIRDFLKAMKPHSSGKVYVNFIADEGHERVVDAYNEKTFRRLRAIKASVDPANLFRMNQNIKPAIAC